MNFLVAKVVAGAQQQQRAQRAREIGVTLGPVAYERGDVVKHYHTTEESAVTEAEGLAKKHPGEQFAVFTVKVIREAKSTLIKKTVNDAGEIVVDKDVPV